MFVEGSTLPAHITHNKCSHGISTGKIESSSPRKMCAYVASSEGSGGPSLNGTLSKSRLGCLPCPRLQAQALINILNLKYEYSN